MPQQYAFFKNYAFKYASKYASFKNMLLNMHRNMHPFKNYALEYASAKIAYFSKKRFYQQKIKEERMYNLISLLINI